MIRILLIDDHAVVRAGYRRFLEHGEGMQVVDEAENAEQGYALYRQHQPDVCVIDLSMPGVGGLELIRRISSQAPKASLLAFSMHEEPVFAQRAIQAGARGYVTKQSAPDILVQAVRELHAGRRFVSQDMAYQLAQTQAQMHPSSLLSPREFEVFRLIEFTAFWLVFRPIRRLRVVFCVAGIRGRPIEKARPFAREDRPLNGLRERVNEAANFD